MPDLTGSPALDLAIGLSFIFLLLSLFASAVQEAIAALLALRAKTLEKGLRNMLAGSPGATSKQLTELYNHRLLRSLYKPGFGPFGKKDGLRLPSYIPPRAFALALIDTLAPNLQQTKADGKPADSHDVIKQLRDEVTNNKALPAVLNDPVLKLLDQARGDIDAFRKSLEEWFDDTMARVSGWYKRQAQLILTLIAVVVVLLLNANAITIGQRLWEDGAVRTAVVQLAETATAETPGDSALEKLENAADAVDGVNTLGVPMGWTDDQADPRYVEFGGQFFYRDLLGWLLTIFAVSLGAPFWFDTLSRLSRLRSSGKPEAPLPASGYGKAGERVTESVRTVRIELPEKAPGTASEESPGTASEESPGTASEESPGTT